MTFIIFEKRKYFERQVNLGVIDCWIDDGVPLWQDGTVTLGLGIIVSQLAAGGGEEEWK